MLATRDNCYFKASYLTIDVESNDLNVDKFKLRVLDEFKKLQFDNMV